VFIAFPYPFGTFLQVLDPFTCSDISRYCLSTCWPRSKNCSKVCKCETLHVTCIFLCTFNLYFQSCYTKSMIMVLIKIEICRKKYAHTHTHTLCVCVCVCVCVLRRKIVYSFGEFHPLRLFVSFLHTAVDSKNGSYFWKSTKLHYSCITYLCSRICLTYSESSLSRWEPNRRQHTKTQHNIGIFTAPQSLQKWVSFYICLYAPEQWMQARRDNGEQIWQFRTTLVLLTVWMRSSNQLALRVFM
jgi:hypothetical protein